MHLNSEMSTGRTRFWLAQVSFCALSRCRHNTGCLHCYFSCSRMCGFAYALTLLVSMERANNATSLHSRSLHSRELSLTVIVSVSVSSGTTICIALLTSFYTIELSTPQLESPMPSILDKRVCTIFSVSTYSDLLWRTCSICAGASSRSRLSPWLQNRWYSTLLNTIRVLLRACSNHSTLIILLLPSSHASKPSMRRT